MYISYLIFSLDTSEGEESQKAVAFNLQLPAISPWRWAGSATPRNPTFRQLTYDAQGELQDYEQYYLELTLANGGQPKWQQLYKFRFVSK